MADSRRLRSIYLAALQSHLWNVMLKHTLRTHFSPDRLTEIHVAGQMLPFPRAVENADLEMLRTLDLPLPCARNHKHLGPWLEIAEQAAQTVGLTVRQLRVKYPRDSFFSKGSRLAWFFPADSTHAIQPDELHPGRRKLVLQFELPRGAYATILIRRIAAEI